MPLVRASARYASVFVGSAVGGAYLHEIGHAIAGWVQGIAVVPTPAKEYVLRPQLYWHQETWIALGGIVGTTLVVVGAMVYFLRERSLVAEAALFGAFVPSWVYTIRFLVLGRGHDSIEWQAAQSVLGLAPAGHALDIFFLCLSLAGIIAWGSRLRRPLRLPLLRFVSMFVAGTILLIALQVCNNRLFDRFFPITQTVDTPPGLDVR